MNKYCVEHCSIFTGCDPQIKHFSIKKFFLPYLCIVCNELHCRWIVLFVLATLSRSLVHHWKPVKQFSTLPHILWIFSHSAFFSGLEIAKNCMVLNLDCRMGAAGHNFLVSKILLFDVKCVVAHYCCAVSTSSSLVITCGWCVLSISLFCETLWTSFKFRLCNDESLTCSFWKTRSGEVKIAIDFLFHMGGGGSSQLSRNRGGKALKYPVATTLPMGLLFPMQLNSVFLVPAMNLQRALFFLKI